MTAIVSQSIRMVSGNGVDKMLPEGIVITTNTDSDMPSLTWKIDFDNNRITTELDEQEAVKQMVHLALITEYQYSDIYSDFGMKTSDLIGQDFFFIVSELKRRITETLTKDSRVSDVSGFEFEEVEAGVLTSFTVATIYGDIESEEVITL